VQEIKRLERVISRGIEARTEIEKRQNKRRAFSVSSGNDPRVRFMLNQAIPHRSISQEDFDADPMAFNVANGTIRFLDFDVPDHDCPDPSRLPARASRPARRRRPTSPACPAPDSCARASRIAVCS
jgi:putative DNA primase/helicase